MCMCIQATHGPGTARVTHTTRTTQTNPNDPPNSYEKGTSCYRQLVKHFGPQIVGEDGGIDRRALGGIVFADPAKRKELEGIVWPEIRRLMERDIQALGEVRARGQRVWVAWSSVCCLTLTHVRVCVWVFTQTGTATAVVEAAVMLEAGWQDAMDEVWVVAVEPEVARWVQGSSCAMGSG